jgi:zinc transporter ZupT
MTAQPGPCVYKFALLSLGAGMLLTIEVEEMAMQAHARQEGGKSNWQPIGLAGRFAVFILLPAYLG